MLQRQVSPLLGQNGVTFRPPSAVCYPQLGRRCQTVAKAAEPDVKETKKGTLDESLLALTKSILDADPEAKEQLKRYEAAIVRLDQARAAQDELEKMYREASKEAALRDAADDEKQRQQATQNLADVEVAAAERLVRAAEMQLQSAEAQRSKWSSAVNEGAEKLESGKAAVIAALAGLAASIPLQALSAQEGLSAALSIGASLGSCLLFGLVYRYAVRKDDGNSHLRGGVVAGFGLVKAAGGADVLQATSTTGPLAVEVIGQSALYAAEACIVFGFASVAIEAAFSSGLLKRFGDAEAANKSS